MTDQERKELIGAITAEYGVKLDPHDPAVIIVDMCNRVLEKHLAQLNSKTGTTASGQDLAQAVTAAYATHVLPRLQAVVSTEVQRMLTKVRPASRWTHPAVVGGSCTLAGVVLGFLLRRLV